MEETIDFNEVWTRAIGGLGDDALTAQQRAFVSLTRPLVGDVLTQWFMFEFQV